MFGHYTFVVTFGFIVVKRKKALLTFWGLKVSILENGR